MPLGIWLARTSYLASHHLLHEFTAAVIPLERRKLRCRPHQIFHYTNQPSTRCELCALRPYIRTKCLCIKMSTNHFIKFVESFSTQIDLFHGLCWTLGSAPLFKTLFACPLSEKLRYQISLNPYRFRWLQEYRTLATLQSVYWWRSRIYPPSTFL